MDNKGESQRRFPRYVVIGEPSMLFNDSSSRVRRRKATVTLAIGYLALSVAIWIARMNPATGHEVSLYLATPTEFWVGFALALLIAMLIGLYGGSPGLQAAGIGLGGLATVSLTALPLIRGYQFYGLYDSLTHLGWTNDIAAGTLDPIGLMYPGIHLVSLTVAIVTGLETETAMLLMVVCMASVFLLFVPLTVRTIVPSREALFVGAFSAFLFLPITNLSTHMSPHTMTQSIFFSALLVFLLVKFLATPLSNPLSVALSLLLALTVGVSVVFHPQLAAHILIAFVGISVVQVLYRLRLRLIDRPRPDQPALYAHTVFLAGVFIFWSSSHGLFGGIGARAVSSAVDFVLGRGGEAGATIGSQSASLLAIGGSVETVFFRLFFVSLVFCLATAAVVLVALAPSWRRRAPDTTILVLSVGAGLAALGPVFVFYFIGTLSEMYFRVFGLMMLFVTILGAVAFTLGANALSDRFSPRAVRPIVAGVLICLLVLSLITVFPSPYIYNQSPHVTEQQMHGHAVAFDNQHEETPYVGVRTGPDRYVDAIYGEGRTNAFNEDVPSEAMQEGLPTYFEGDRYVIVTETDEQRETAAYNELRYGESDFQAVESQPEVHKVHSNGEFEMYLVNSEREAPEPPDQPEQMS